jgi:hypothetical protein
VTTHQLRRAATLVALAAVAGVPASGQPVDDSRLKAAIVSKFPDFVQWPPAAVPSDGPLVLCLSEGGPIERHLRDVVDGISIHDRPVAVHVLTSVADVARCHLLFISTASRLEATALLQASADLPILTVADDPTLLERGVILTLRPVDGRLRFDADLDAAERAGLRLRSQFLRLAVDVRGGHQ